MGYVKMLLESGRGATYLSGCFSNSENLASEYENAPTSSTSHYKKAPPIKSKAKSVDPDRPYQSRINNRLSSSVGEVLLEASDNEECDLEPVRPLTACAGDNSLSYLHMVHENQARRLKSRSAWFLCSENVPSATSWKSVSQMPIRSATTPERMIESSKLFEPILSKETTRSRAPLGESTFGAPLNTSSAENAQPSMDRRRSWKTQMKAFSQHPSHSLDCTETEETGSPKLRCHAVSVEADTWLTDVVAFHQAPKKRKSLKKKMSTQF